MVLQSKTDMAAILLLLHVTAMPTEDIPLVIRIRTADIPRHHRDLLRETALPTQPHLVPTITDVADHTLPTRQPMDLGSQSCHSLMCDIIVKIPKTSLSSNNS